jgi:hypothetical protein
VAQEPLFCDIKARSTFSLALFVMRQLPFFDRLEGDGQAGEFAKSAFAITI